MWLSTLLLPQNYKKCGKRAENGEALNRFAGHGMEGRNWPPGALSLAQTAARAATASQHAGTSGLPWPLIHQRRGGPMDGQYAARLCQVLWWGDRGSNPFGFDLVDRCVVSLAHPQNETFSRKSAANLLRFYPAAERSAQGRKPPPGASFRTEPAAHVAFIAVTWHPPEVLRRALVRPNVKKC